MTGASPSRASGHAVWRAPAPWRRGVALLLLFALVCLSGAANAQGRKGSKQGAAPVILISIDGFRPSWLHRGDTPMLDALANSGVFGLMEPSFPTLTFPNHLAMVTGQRPDRTGIVANGFEDPARPDRPFKLSDVSGQEDPFWWTGTEPIWITAEKQGIRTGTLFWPGASATIQGIRPSDTLRYDMTLSSEKRVDTVIGWLARPALTRPRFVALYFDEVDAAGHRFGPDAPETAAAIGRVDSAIARLRAALAARDLPADLVIVSDHGMAPIGPDQSVDLDRFVARADYRIIQSGPFTTIAPVAGKEQTVAQALSGRRGNMTCWPRAQVPAQYRYGAHARVAPIVCLADFGWTIGQGRPAAIDRGGHGYDPAAPEMAALLIANGPSFPGPPRAVGKVPNIQLYPLLAQLLGIAPLAHDVDPEIAAITARWLRDQAAARTLVKQMFPGVPSAKAAR